MDDTKLEEMEDLANEMAYEHACMQVSPNAIEFEHTVEMLFEKYMEELSR